LTTGAESGDRIIAVIQARMTSTRLPGKVLLPLQGVPLLSRVIERAVAIGGVDGVVVAAPYGLVHDPIEEVVGSHPGVLVVRGSETDLLSRTLDAADAAAATAVVRITSDCPCIDPSLSGAVVAAYRSCSVVYARTSFTSGFPQGLDAEVVSVEALRQAAAADLDDYEREHATPYIWRRPDEFPAVHLLGLPDRRSWRLTVDTPEDYELIRIVYDELGPSNPLFGLGELVELFRRRPELLEINASVIPTAYQPLP
jgi:spore coat polysaccharide biosynthesis protein SpsF